MRTDAPGSATPPGLVAFAVDGILTAPQPIDLNGISRITLVLQAGAHTVAAHYQGTGNYLPSASATLSLTVDRASSTLTMASNPAQLNQAVAIRAAPTLVNSAGIVTVGTSRFLK